MWSCKPKASHHDALHPQMQSREGNYGQTTRTVDHTTFLGVRVGIFRGLDIFLNYW